MFNLVRLYLADQQLAGLAPETLKWYECHLVPFVEFSQSTPPETAPSDPHEITPGLVSAYLGQLDLAEATRAGHWRAIRAFWHWASDPARGYINPPPRGFRPRFKPTAPRHVPSPDAVKALLADLPRRTRAQRRDFALFHFIYYTGTRLGEALSLKLDALDLERGVATIYGQKVSKYRAIPLIDPLRIILYGWIGHAGEPWVFPAFRRSVRQDAPVSRFTASERWRTYQRGRGVPESDMLRVHDLRHCFATHAHAAGLDPLDLQNILGHSSLSTVQIYTRYQVDPLREKLHAGGFGR